MRERSRKIGLCVGICLFILLNLLVPSPSCHDGWNSVSIGRKGACSHHGGVNDYGEWRFIALILSVIAGCCTKQAIQGKQDSDAEEIRISELSLKDQGKEKLKSEIKMAILKKRRVCFMYLAQGEKMTKKVTTFPIALKNIPIRLKDDAECFVGVRELESKASVFYSLNRITAFEISQPRK